MRLLNHLHDPEPHDVHVTTYDYEGEPRVRIGMGNFSIHGTHAALALVVAEMARGLAALTPAKVRLPMPLAGDHTFIGPAIVVDPTTPPGEVQLVNRDGDIVGRITGILADNQRQGISVGTEPEVFEGGVWRPARPGEVEPDAAELRAAAEVIRDQDVEDSPIHPERFIGRPLSAELDEADHQASAPFEDLGGPTDG